MGLDSVELIMDVEEHFDIQIDNETAGRISTLGDLEAVVVRLASDADQVWPRLKRVVAESTGHQESMLDRSQRIVEDLGVD